MKPNEICYCQGKYLCIILVHTHDSWNMAAESNVRVLRHSTTDTNMKYSLSKTNIPLNPYMCLMYVYICRQFTGCHDMHWAHSLTAHDEYYYMSSTWLELNCTFYIRKAAITYGI